MKYFNYCEDAARCLEKLEIADGAGKQIDIEQGFEDIVASFNKQRTMNKAVYFIGNGASASMASHTALDLWKNAGIKAHSFNDLVSLTAISNDFSFKDVFARPLGFFADSGDMLMAISSSGKSSNILEAVACAKKIGLYVATLSAMDKDNPLRKQGDINFYIPAGTYGLAEAGHQLLIHFMTDKISSLLH